MTARRAKSAPAKSTPAQAAAYAVGYGKPPRHTQFQKGQSGNPGGRPQRPPDLDRVTEMVLEEAFRPVMIEEDGAMVPVEALRAAMRSHFGLAISGNYMAQHDVLKAVMHAEESRFTAAKREFDDWESDYDEAYEEDEEEWAEEHAESEEEDDDYESECRADGGGESGEDDAGDEQEDEDDSGEDDETGESRDEGETGEVDEPGHHAEVGAAARVSAVTEAPDAVPPVPPAALSRRRRRAALRKARRAKSRFSKQAARYAWRTPHRKSAPAEKSRKIPC